MSRSKVDLHRVVWAERGCGAGSEETKMTKHGSNMDPQLLQVQVELVRVTLPFATLLRPHLYYVYPYYLDIQCMGCDCRITPCFFHSYVC